MRPAAAAAAERMTASASNSGREAISERLAPAEEALLPNAALDPSPAKPGLSTSLSSAASWTAPSRAPVRAATTRGETLRLGSDSVAGRRLAPLMCPPKKMSICQCGERATSLNMMLKIRNISEEELTWCTYCVSGQLLPYFQLAGDLTCRAVGTNTGLGCPVALRGGRLRLTSLVSPRPSFEVIEGRFEGR